MRNVSLWGPDMTGRQGMMLRGVEAMVSCERVAQLAEAPQNR
jgi:hypothetical protein